MASVKSFAKRAFLAAATLVLAACAREGAEGQKPAPDDAGGGAHVVSLARTACFGFCPIYEASVDHGDRLVFTGERFVAAEGVREKALPAGSFDRLVAIARAHDFESFDPVYPDDAQSNCESWATDLPGVALAVRADGIDHAVRFDLGCFGFEGRERLEEMIAEFDAVLDLDEWIGPREPHFGARD
jgi:hypothetical protein